MEKNLANSKLNEILQKNRRLSSAPSFLQILLAFGLVNS